MGQVQLFRLFAEVSDKNPPWTHLNSLVHSQKVISDTKQRCGTSWSSKQLAPAEFKISYSKIQRQVKHTARTTHLMSLILFTKIKVETGWVTDCYSIVIAHVLTSRSTFKDGGSPWNFRSHNGHRHIMLYASNITQTEPKRTTEKLEFMALDHPMIAKNLSPHSPFWHRGLSPQVLHLSAPLALSVIPGSVTRSAPWRSFPMSFPDLPDLEGQ